MHTATTDTLSFSKSGTDSSHDDFNIGITEFCRLYTTGELTLCQAVNGLRTYVMNVGYGNQMLAEHALNFIGHRFTEQDEIAIETGFNGDVDAWLSAGNLPQGWYSLFKDNYPSYCREIKTKHDQNSKDA